MKGFAEAMNWLFRRMEKCQLLAIKAIQFSVQSLLSPCFVYK
jgi:hypothetical protein